MKPGDKVVCIKLNQWVIGFGPHHNEIVTLINSFSIRGETFFEFKEYPQLFPWGSKQVDYNARYFRPIDYTYGTEVCEKLEKELSETLIPESV